MKEKELIKQYMENNQLNIEKIDKDNLLHYYSYYVDATTGEIIGGEIGDLLTYEDNLKLDVYNMV